MSRAAAGFLIAGAVVACVGVASASETKADAVIGVTTANTWNPPTVKIQTGDTVTWDYTGSTVVHNRKGETGPAEDQAWFVPTQFKSSGTDEHTFNLPGTYTFVCQAHPATMTGSVVVTGAPDTPTPTASASPSPSPSASPTPTPTPRPSAATPTPAPDHTTPAPAGTSRLDTTRPAISKLKLKAVKRGVKVSFSLSEPAVVTTRVKRGKRTVRTVRLSVRPGARSVTLRGMARGRYSVEIEARDARGNRTATQRKTVRVAR